ncbi:MAG: hypothetical protein ABRQ26_05650 [Syntrophomonadaceae bacterium]
MAKYDQAVCPRCLKKSLIALVYGQPRWDIFREQEKGTCRFGGCMLKQNSKRWVCTECGAKGDDEELSSCQNDDKSTTGTTYAPVSRN